MRRRDFLGLVGTSLLGWRAMAAQRRPPNFVFILADDLGWGDLRCYGNPIAITPNIDRLAQQGLRFTQFYVSSPVCSPTRVAFMTGLFPGRLGIHAHISGHELNQKRGMPDSLNPGVPTVAKLLREAGYATGHFGKWHMGVIEAREYGFDEYRTVVGGGSNTWKPDLDFRRFSSQWIMDEALRFIEAHRGEPFYVNIWTTHPHAPLDPTDEQLKPYQRFVDKRLPPGRYITPLQVFYAVVTELDRQVGRLLQRLEEWGLAENTVVIFSSDNGPEEIQLLEAAHSGVGSPGPFRGRKRSLYEGGIRTPFILRWPAGAPPGRVDHTTVLSSVDFLPTVCRLAGVELPKGMALDGEDMSEAWRGRPRQRTKPLMWEWRFRILGPPLHRSPILAIRVDRWKLLMNPDRSRVELYDILRDPMEVDNVASQHPDLVEELARQVLAWQATLPPGPMDPEAGSNAYPWPQGSD